MSTNSMIRNAWREIQEPDDEEIVVDWLKQVVALNYVHSQGNSLSDLTLEEFDMIVEAGLRIDK